MENKYVSRSYLWWPNMDKDCEANSEACEACASVSDRNEKVPYISGKSQNYLGIELTPIS